MIETQQRLRVCSFFWSQYDKQEHSWLYFLLVSDIWNQISWLDVFVTDFPRTFLACIIVAILTARIRNFQEHLQKHPKVSNKEQMQFFISASIKLWEHFALYLYFSLCEKQDILFTHLTKSTFHINMDVKLSTSKSFKRKSKNVE